MPSQTARAGRKRANSADHANALKRSRGGGKTNGTGGESYASGTTRRGGRKRDANVDPDDSPKKRKIKRQNGISKQEIGDDSASKAPFEARPDLGPSKLVQAVPTSASAADSQPERDNGQGKVSSWQAFKLAALKLKEAGHTSVKIEIDEKTPLYKFFPLLPRSIFRSIPFKNCALEYRFDSEGDKPAGASLVAEIELKGPLGELVDVFKSVLGQKESVLRVSAFLGVTPLDYDKDVEIESLSMAGCFLGCNIQYPADTKLIRITSLGATIGTVRRHYLMPRKLLYYLTLLERM